VAQQHRRIHTRFEHTPLYRTARNGISGGHKTLFIFDVAFTRRFQPRRGYGLADIGSSRTVGTVFARSLRGVLGGQRIYAVLPPNPSEMDGRRRYGLYSVFRQLGQAREGILPLEPPQIPLGNAVINRVIKQNKKTSCRHYRLRMRFLRNT